MALKRALDPCRIETSGLALCAPPPPPTKSLDPPLVRNVFFLRNIAAVTKQNDWDGSKPAWINHSFYAMIRI